MVGWGHSKCSACGVGDASRGEEIARMAAEIDKTPARSELDEGVDAGLDELGRWLRGRWRRAIVTGVYRAEGEGESVSLREILLAEWGETENAFEERLQGWRDILVLLPGLEREYQREMNYRTRAAKAAAAEAARAQAAEAESAKVVPLHVVAPSGQRNRRRKRRGRRQP